MIKHVKMLLLSLAIATMLMTASPAEAQSVPAYRTTFYSDATHQTVVGHLVPQCRTFPYVYVQYHLFGTTSPYSIDELVFFCGEGGPEPITLFKGMDKPWEPFGSSADSLARVEEPAKALRSTG